VKNDGKKHGTKAAMNDYVMGKKPWENFHKLQENIGKQSKPQVLMENTMERPVFFSRIHPMP
jgi:hypothetical protein